VYRMLALSEVDLLVTTLQQLRLEAFAHRRPTSGPLAQMHTSEHLLPTAGHVTRCHAGRRLARLTALQEWVGPGALSSSSSSSICGSSTSTRCSSTNMHWPGLVMLLARSVER